MAAVELSLISKYYCNAKRAAVYAAGIDFALCEAKRLRFRRRSKVLLPENALHSGDSNAAARMQNSLAVASERLAIRRTFVPCATSACSNSPSAQVAGTAEAMAPSAVTANATSPDSCKTAAKLWPAATDPKIRHAALWMKLQREG